MDSDTPAICKECPFRVKSLKGYVGGHESFNEILALVHFHQKFPCHMKVNALQLADDLEFDEAVEQAPHCAGALAYMNATCIRPRDKELQDQCDVVGRREDVFRTPMEGMLYHDGKITPLLPSGIELSNKKGTEGKRAKKKKPSKIKATAAVKGRRVKVGRGCARRP